MLINKVYEECWERIEDEVIFAVEALVKKAYRKDSEASTGFEPMTSVIPV